MRIMFSVCGHRVGGTGTASSNLRKQIPKMIDRFPELGHFHPATLNVEFDHRIIVIGADYRSPRIRWNDEPDGEVFDIVRVRLRLDDNPRVFLGLMYIAHWSTHRSDASKHEFLVEEFVTGLRQNSSVVMECDRESIELNYRKAPTIIVF